jgi:hypothetical protein
MKKRLYGYGGLLLVLLLTAAAVRYRPLIQLRVWHWRNGDSVTISAYRVPVPPSWYVHIHDTTQLIITDTRPQYLRDRVVAPNLEVMVIGRRDLQKWKAAIALTSDHQWKEFPVYRIGGSTALCFARDYFGHIPQAAGKMISLDCQTEGGIEILANGMKEDESALSGLIAGITKP